MKNKAKCGRMRGMPDIIQPIQQLIQAALAEQKSKLIPRDEPVISISTRTSRASFVYERMRNAVDYKEEHLVRRTAIERILRRMISNNERKNIAENLTHELIHARYLPNDAIPQRRLVELDKILDKYFWLLGVAPSQEILSSKSLPSWTLSIMASEIDEFLVPPYVMHASINAMYEAMNKQIHIEEPPEAAERSKQIYLAVSRTLYHNDENLRYHLFLLYYPAWKTADADLIKEVGANLSLIRQSIENDLNHKLKEKLNAAMRKQVVYFTILSEIISKDPLGGQRALQNGNSFVEKINQACENHYQEARGKMRRSIARSVIYLILTKFLLALVLEIPIEIWFLNHFDAVPLLINLIFPPSLLIIIALSTRLPGANNTEIITRGILKFLSQQTDIIQVAKTRKRSIVWQLLFVLFYGALFVLSFGSLIYGLKTLNFTFVSMFIFLLFLSLVSLFAYRIRRNSQELIVTPPKRGIVRALWNFLTIPILHAGKWMSTRFAQINVFIFILDFVIEAPFKSFIKITEEWMSFVHEKKDEI